MEGREESLASVTYLCILYLTCNSLMGSMSTRTPDIFNIWLECPPSYVPGSTTSVDLASDADRRMRLPEVGA
jgi:hypothetical protein